MTGNWLGKLIINTIGYIVFGPKMLWQWARDKITRRRADQGGCHRGLTPGRKNTRPKHLGDLKDG